MDIQLLFFGAIILVIVLMMVRNGRKRQKDQLALSQGLKPGAEVMTTFGLYGTIVSIDEDENKVVLQISPGATATVHRQAVNKVVAPIAEDEAISNGEPVVLDDAAADPAFGQRVSIEKPVDDPQATGRASGKVAD